MKLITKIKWLLKQLCPYRLIVNRNNKKQREKEKKENKIRDYFLNLEDSHDDAEMLEIKRYFINLKFTIFPYEFNQKYYNLHINVFFDNEGSMNYVFYENKRLYFPDNYNRDAVERYFVSLLLEQDLNSPHRYETDQYMVKEGDKIVDIGAAEGIWALNYVEIAKHIYIFECDKNWVKALQKTFEPWKEKVTIIGKYVSDRNDAENITLDECLNNASINFVKIDAEGMEMSILRGGKALFTNNQDIKLLVCTYHKQNDAIEIKDFLELLHYQTEYSKGYILFIYDELLNEPYARRCLLRAMR